MVLIFKFISKNNDYYEIYFELKTKCAIIKTIGLNLYQKQ